MTGLHHGQNQVHGKNVAFLSLWLPTECVHGKAGNFPIRNVGKEKGKGREEEEERRKKMGRGRKGKGRKGKK